MTSIQHTVNVAAPQNETFANLTDPNRMRRWMGANLSTNAPLARGARFQQTFQVGGSQASLEATVEALQPDHLLVLVYRHAHFNARVSWRLTATSGGCRVDCQVAVEYTSLKARLAGPIFARSLERNFHDLLQQLKMSSERLQSAA